MSPQPAAAHNTAKQRNTKQGAAVRAALVQAEGFCSAQDVFTALRAAGSAVGLSTVYRHLQALVDGGEVDVIHTPEGESTYRACGQAHSSHHHHLVCRGCGRAVEIEGRALEHWATHVAREHGFTDVAHTVELFGTCPACAAAR